MKYVALIILMTATIACNKKQNVVTETPKIDEVVYPPIFNGRYGVKDSVVTVSHFNGQGNTITTDTFAYNKDVTVMLDSSTNTVMFQGLNYKYDSAGKQYVAYVTDYRTITLSKDSFYYNHFQSIGNHTSRSIILRGNRAK